MTRRLLAAAILGLAAVSANAGENYVPYPGYGYANPGANSAPGRGGGPGGGAPGAGGGPFALAAPARRHVPHVGAAGDERGREHRSAELHGVQARKQQSGPAEDERRAAVGSASPLHAAAVWVLPA